jgi:hypothetical protein
MDQGSTAPMQMPPRRAHGFEDAKKTHRLLKKLSKLQAISASLPKRHASSLRPCGTGWTMTQGLRS